MKKLANLKGVKTLNLKEQKSVNGGGLNCNEPACSLQGGYCFGNRCIYWKL